jgi:hypothetical protein
MCHANAGGPTGSARCPSQMMGQGLRDVPVVPELRFAPRRTRSWIPGCTARGGATDPGLPLWCSFLHRQMSRCPARAGVGDCLHESTPLSRSGQACRSFFPIGRLQTAARHTGPHFYAGGTKKGLSAGLMGAAAFVTHCGPPPRPAPAPFVRRNPVSGRQTASACRGACHPWVSHRPGIAHSQGGLTPTRRTSPDRPRAATMPGDSRATSQR